MARKTVLRLLPLWFLFLGTGLLQAQDYTHEGESLPNGNYIGKQIWRDDTGQQIAEVIYSDEGDLLSFMTWYEGDIMDAVKLDPDRKRGELPLVEVDPEERLVFFVEKKGIGAKPVEGDKVAVHYQGLLQDKTLFDSNFGKKPFKFTLGKRMVIEGFEWAVKQMQVGSVVWVHLPQEMGYGARVAGEIPPFSNLWYQIELVEIK